MILRDDFIFPATFIAQHSVHVQQHTICERGGHLDCGSHLGVIVTLKGNASQRTVFLKRYNPVQYIGSNVMLNFLMFNIDFPGC